MVAPARGCVDGTAMGAGGRQSGRGDRGGLPALQRLPVREAVGLAADPVEVHCSCPSELALQRCNARVTHPVHVVTTLQLEAMAEYDRPVGVGTLVTVDTAVTVTVNAVAAAVRDCRNGIHHDAGAH